MTCRRRAVGAACDGTAGSARAAVSGAHPPDTRPLPRRRTSLQPCSTASSVVRGSRPNARACWGAHLHSPPPPAAPSARLQAERPAPAAAQHSAAPRPLRQHHERPGMPRSLRCRSGLLHQLVHQGHVRAVVRRLRPPRCARHVASLPGAHVLAAVCAAASQCAAAALFAVSVLLPHAMAVCLCTAMLPEHFLCPHACYARMLTCILPTPGSNLPPRVPPHLNRLQRHQAAHPAAQRATAACQLCQHHSRRHVRAHLQRGLPGRSVQPMPRRQLGARLVRPLHSDLGLNGFPPHAAPWEGARPGQQSTHHLGAPPLSRNSAQSSPGRGRACPRLALQLLIEYLSWVITHT